MYEETIKSSPIEENEPILQAEQPHVEEEKPDIVVEQTDNFTDKMNINMPHNPKDKMAEHPKEIRKEIVKGGRKKKK